MEQQFDFNKELTGKIALVTGGTKGAGKAIAERLSKTGATVVITARKKSETGMSQYCFIAADLSKPQGARTVAEEVLSRFGRLDILINSLGGSETNGGGFAVLTDEDWQHAIQTNLLAPVRLERAFLPQMLSQNSGGDCSYRLHSGKVAAIRFHFALCCRKGRVDQLQQRPVKGGFSQRNQSSNRLTGLDHDGVVCQNDGADFGKFRQYSGGSYTECHGCAGRNSDRPPRTA